MCIYGCMHKYVYMCVYVICVCICVWMCICVHMCVCICMSVFTISIDRSPNHGNTAAHLPGWGSRDGMWRVAAMGLELHISVAELCGFPSLGGPWSWPFSPSCGFPGVEAGWTLIKLYLPSPLAGHHRLGLSSSPETRPQTHSMCRSRCHHPTVYPSPFASGTETFLARPDPQFALWTHSVFPL